MQNFATSEKKATGPIAVGHIVPSHSRQPKIAVVIPCYKVTEHIVSVISSIGPEISFIICVDDACPEGSSKLILDHFPDDGRLRLLTHESNAGVGAATCTGYRAAIDAGADIIVKMDGDGQMEPCLIPSLVQPIIEGAADYVKGNRFFSIETVRQMSLKRIIGNAGLSFLTKLSSGYWDLFDPTNGFTAIDARVAHELPLEKLHRRFFFESDMLFRLGTLRARVLELPMIGVYANETSNISEFRALLTFPFLHLRNFLKRLLYSYFVRGFSVASLNLVFGLCLVGFGVVFGLAQWGATRAEGIAATSGTVMLAALPILVGIQMLFAFFAYDIAMVPRTPIHTMISRIKILAKSKHEKRSQ